MNENNNSGENFEEELPPNEPERGEEGLSLNPIQNVNDPEEEEDDEDFPDYANEQNKQLNQIIKEKRKLNKEIRNKIEEKQDRVKILQEHLKNVQAELLHTQALNDARNKEIETEDHLKQITERQIGRIESELRKLEKLGIEQQERLNDIQNQIFKGNEKMDQFKLEMNWKQEELEQWALAARQKEDDNITLEKYKRADDAKIKELNLVTERLTIEVGRKQAELEKEVTETQATQIELDKTGEEFKQHHEERHKLFLQWHEVSENIARRDQAIVEEGENFAAIKMKIKENQRELEKRKKYLLEEKGQNKNLEMQIGSNERKIVEERTENKKVEEELLNLEAEVEILKNQLSAFASELAQKKNKCSILSQELLSKKQRLNNAQKKYNAQKLKLENQDLLAKEFNMAKEEAEERFKENEKGRKELEIKIRVQKDTLFKHTQDLFKEREKEANLYGEIQGTMAACRNLQSHINKLNQEFQRQQELLYNAEYQIQLMERRVNRARGERTLEEKKDLENEIKEAEEKFVKISQDHKLLSASMKKIDDDLRAIERKLTFFEENKKKYKTNIEGLQLENDMTYQDLNKIVKVKEDILVQYDCMKLELKKIKEHLNGATDEVFNLENRKYQLEMSMQEREKEINVHRDVLIAEHKAAEEERHRIAVELAERANKVKNLKIKYESLVQKHKGSTGEVETVNEHSQAYYIIKAAQEREELQRKGDELNAKIKKSEKELKALDNTISHLQSRNSKYRDSFLNKGVTEDDVEHKATLEEQCKYASQNVFKRQKELQKMKKDYDEDLNRYTELNNKYEILIGQRKQYEMALDKARKDLEEQNEKLSRAKKTLLSKTNTLKTQKISLTEDNVHVLQMKYDIENNKNKALQSALMILIGDFPELKPLLENCLKEKNMNLPSKAPSSIDIMSQKSSISGSSRK